MGRFGFVHAVYRQVLYERMSASRRIHAHRRIGERGEELYGERTKEIAAEPGSSSGSRSRLASP
jgi:hypothetical protein